MSSLGYRLVKTSLYILKSYDFVRACLPRGMVRACSLSLILFPRASALHKIARNIHFSYIFSFVLLSTCCMLQDYTNKQHRTSVCCKTDQTSYIEAPNVARLTKQATFRPRSRQTHQPQPIIKNKKSANSSKIRICALLY